MNDKRKEYLKKWREDNKEHISNYRKEYAKTRNNMGFMTIDRLCDELNLDVDKEDIKGVYGRFKYQGEDIFILKPYTYMNLSGQSVKALMSYFKIDVKDLIVVYDDLALPPGKMRMRPSGSSGGQKGIQNIIDLLGTSEIKRIRIGIGEPRFNTVDYVLGVPTGDEAILIDQAIDKAVNALKVTLKEGFDKAMAKCNG